jgi:hypothetical protein
LYLGSGHLQRGDAGRFIGHCRHWGELGFTSAMRRIADSGGVEQSDGSFCIRELTLPTHRRH